MRTHQGCAHHYLVKQTKIPTWEKNIFVYEKNITICGLGNCLRIIGVIAGS